MEDVFTWINEAIENDQICILLFHKISDELDAHTISKDSFERVLAYISKKRDVKQIHVVNFSEMIEMQTALSKTGFKNR